MDKVEAHAYIVNTYARLTGRPPRWGGAARSILYHEVASLVVWGFGCPPPPLGLSRFRGVGLPGGSLLGGGSPPWGWCLGWLGVSVFFLAGLASPRVVWCIHLPRERERQALKKEKRGRIAEEDAWTSSWSSHWHAGQSSAEEHVLLMFPLACRPERLPPEAPTGVQARLRRAVTGGVWQAHVGPQVRPQFR